MIAGPNGSGKTTLINDLRNKVNFGHYLNADDIERELKKTSILDLSLYNTKFTDKEFQEFLNQTTFTKKIKRKSILKELIINEKKSILETKGVNSYVAAIITQFLRNKFIKTRQTFSFETVMSHESKLKLLEKARKREFKVYLYYVATESPVISEARVELRVKQGGHPVEKSKIKNRYYRSLDLLLNAIRISDRAYLFDNSSDKYRLVAEVTGGRTIRINDDKFIPQWFINYVENKLI